jgi:hypothetical protein
MAQRFWCLHDICDTMRYKDVTNWLVATPTFTVDADTALGAGNMTVIALKAYQQPCCLCQVLRPHQP